MLSKQSTCLQSPFIINLIVRINIDWFYVSGHYLNCHLNYRQVRLGLKHPCLCNRFLPLNMGLFIKTSTNWREKSSVFQIHWFALRTNFSAFDFFSSYIKIPCCWLVSAITNPAHTCALGPQLPKNPCLSLTQRLQSESQAQKQSVLITEGKKIHEEQMEKSGF